MPLRPSRIALIPLVAALLGLAPGAHAEEEGSGIIVATPWEVRRAASELLDDLKDRRGEVPRLLDRAQALLAEHGDAPIPYGAAWTPLSMAMADHLQRIGLAETFVRFYGPAAERRLDELLAAPSLDETALAALARQYPGTPAAQRAWRMLANRAWDRGHLGSYLHRARRGGETGDDELSARVTAARELLRPKRTLELPSTLDGLVEMWSIADLPLGQQAPVGLSTHRRGDEEPVPATFTFSGVDRDLVATSDGRLFFAFDPLFGERVGQVHDLVANPSGGPHLQPVIDGRGFVAMAMDLGSNPVALAIDHDGERRWRTDIPIDNVSALSAPVVLDDLLTVALSVPTGGGTELRVVALDQITGALRWNVLVAKDPRGIRHRFRHFGGTNTAPSLTVHAGSLVICSHSGLLAELGVDGNLRRVWNYTSAAARAPQLLDYRSERSGAVRSDGEWLVATPADTANLLIIGPDDDEPRIYSGLGAADDLLDLADGTALLAGARVTLLDVARGEPQWSQPVGAAAAARWGRIGAQRAMVVLDSPEVIGQQILLNSLRGGKRIAERPIGSEDSMTVAGDLVITAGPDTRTEGDTRIIVGYGDERGFQRLKERAEAEPDNPRPLIGLASLYRARGEMAQAYDYLVRAIELGAPPAMAEAAAKLARRLVDLSLGGEGFPTAVARLERLAPHVAGMAGEATWWRGRHAELTGDLVAAQAAFRQARAAPPTMVAFVEGLAVDLHALAELGLTRTGGAPPPAWARHAGRQTTPLVPAVAWSWDRRFLTEPLVGDELILGYTEGQLQAFALVDGSLRWTRAVPADEAPFLGVRMTGNGGAGAVRIEVIPGSAADHAGFEDGDLITHFNGRELAGFKTLVEAIAGSGDERTFSARVNRPDEAGQQTVVELDGTLGTQLLQATAMVDGLILARRMTLIDEMRGGWRLEPDRARDPQAEIVDQATGEVLWRRRLSQDGEQQTDPEPLLIEGGILLLVEDGTLRALDIRRDAREVWRLDEVGAAADMRILPGGLVLLAGGGHGKASVIDASDGRLLMELPMHSDAELLLDDGDCFARTTDGRLAAWDIGVGRLRWTRDRGDVTPLALADDAVYVLDAERRLAVLDRPSGETRRTFGDFPTIHENLVTANRIFIHARKADGVDVVACIDRQTDAPLWEYPLPERLELRGELISVADGIGLVLDTLDQPPGLLVIDGAGQTVMAQLLHEQEQIIATPIGVLANGPDGLRLLPPSIPPAGEALPCPPVAAGKDLKASAAAAQEAAPWRTVGKSGYLIARAGQHLLVLAQVQPDSDGITIHIADQGPLAEAPTQTLVIRPGHSPVFDRRDGGWHLSGVRRINQNDAAWTVAVRLTPPPMRLPTTGLVLRAAADGEIDGPEAPWWLRAAWRPVQW